MTLIECLQKCEEWFFKKEPTAVLPGTKDMAFKTIQDAIRNQEVVSMAKTTQPACLRYFFVSYHFKTTSGWGNGCVGMKKNKFINKKELIQFLMEGNKGIENVVIFGIIEMTESDYSDFFE